MASGKWTQEESVIESALRDGASEILSLAEEMGEWRDALEEKLSHTEKYESVSAAADTLEGSDIEGLVDALLTAIESAGLTENSLRFGRVTLVESVPSETLGNQKIFVDVFTPYKGKSASRANRLAAAVNGMRTALEEVEAALDTATEAVDEDKGAAEADREFDPKLDDERDEKLDEIKSALQEVENALDEIDCVEFPGMYG